MVGLCYKTTLGLNMGLYRKGTDFKIKDNAVTLFTKDKSRKTENYYCRFSNKEYINLKILLQDI